MWKDDTISETGFDIHPGISFIPAFEYSKRFHIYQNWGVTSFYDIFTENATVSHYKWQSEPSNQAQLLLITH